MKAPTYRPGCPATQMVLALAECIVQRRDYCMWRADRAAQHQLNVLAQRNADRTAQLIAPILESQS